MQLIEFPVLRSRFSFTSVQSLSGVRLVETPWTVARQASLSITNSRSLLKLMSIESVMPSNHLILCSLLLLPSSFPASGSFPMSRLFPYWSFSFTVLPVRIQGWCPLGLTGLISLQFKGKSPHKYILTYIHICIYLYTIFLFLFLTYFILYESLGSCILHTLNLLPAPWTQRLSA